MTDAYIDELWVLIVIVQAQLIICELQEMFKKRKIEKKTDIAKDLDEIHEEDHQNQQKIQVPKGIFSKKINKFSTKPEKHHQQHKLKQLQTPAVKYGLIDKDQVDSKHHANLQAPTENKVEHNSLVNLYVKKKMDEINREKSNANMREDHAASQIINLQRKYLELQKQKLAEYDVAEIQKKLQNMANYSIKNQLNYRANYLKDLLQNEHERMEYASQKELKTLRQEKDRLEKNFQSKYNDHGRRSYIEKLKHDSLVTK